MKKHLSLRYLAMNMCLISLVLTRCAIEKYLIINEAKNVVSLSR